MAIILQGTIAALGYFENGVYYREPDCFESLRDIIRFLRNDDKQFAARCKCGESNIVENDLVPIMCTQGLTNELFDVCLRLCANLLQPTLVTFQGKPPEDKDQEELYVKLQGYLSRSKSAFANSELFKVLRLKMEKYFMDTPLEDRDEDDRLLMERILLLLRFIFSIGQTYSNNEHMRRAHEVQDLVMKAFLGSGIETVLIFIGSSRVDRDFHLSALEIISLTLKEYDPQAILEAKNGRNEETKKKDEMELRQVFEEEERKRVLQQRNAMSLRHSRFAGSYVIKGRSSINPEKDMLAMKVVKDPTQTDYIDERKKKKILPKNRRITNERSLVRAPPTSLALLMNEYIEKIFEGCYNNLTRSTKEMAFNGSTRTQAHRNADVQFFVFLRFCLQYARLAKLPLEKVNGMLGKEAFHFVQVKINDYLEITKIEKQKAKYHGMKAQYALSSYKELILYHQYLIDHGTQVEKEFGLETCDHILKMQEYRELGILIFKQFTPGVLTKGFLRELILATHYYLRILERSAKNNSLKIIKKHKKKKQKKTKQSDKVKLAKVTEKKYKLLDKMTENQLEELWNVLQTPVEEALLETDIDTDDLMPINSTLQVEDDDHKRFLLLRIQRALRDSDVKLAVGLNKAGRQLFPTDDTFGKDGDFVEELAHLKELFFVDLREVAVSLQEAEAKLEGYLKGTAENEENEEYDEYSEEEEENFDLVEENFEFNSHLVQFARHDILKWYILILNDFLTNSSELNKAVVKMLHRIAFDLKDPSRIYQVSFFQVLLNVKSHILSIDKEKQKESPHYELYKFGYHFLTSFVNAFQRIGPQLLLESLFWKSPKECYEIEHGFGSYFSNQKESAPQAWTEELEIEVRDLHREFADMDERPAGMDMLDFIEHNLSRPRSRKQINRKLKELGLDTLGAKMGKGTLSGFPLIPAKDAYTTWQGLGDDNKPDLVDYIQKQLLEEHGEFSRPKIIKQLAYIGANYEGKTKSGVRREARMKPWSDGLLSELRALKEQYEETPDEERLGATLLNYTLRLLSEKKPRKQVIQQLVVLGADLSEEMRKETEEKASRKKKIMKPESSDDDEEVGERSASEPEASESDNSRSSDGEKNEKETRRSKKSHKVKKSKAKHHFDESYDDEAARPQSSLSDKANSASSQQTAELTKTRSKITKKRPHFDDSEDDAENVQDEETQKASHFDTGDGLAEKSTKRRTLLNDSDMEDDDEETTLSTQQTASQSVVRDQEVDSNAESSHLGNDLETSKLTKKRQRFEDSDEEEKTIKESIDDQPSSTQSSISDNMRKQTSNDAATKRRRVVLSDDSDSD